MAKKTERPKDLKKQRWAAIVAAILAFGMIASVVGGYLGHALGGEGAGLPQQQAEPEPEDYLAHYEGEVKRLEEHLKEHEPSPAVLQELAENYRYLSLIHQLYFDDPEAVAEYQNRLISLYDDLVDLEPDNLNYRLELISLYQEQQKDEALIMQEVAILKKLLRDDPNPSVHFSLIAVLEAGEMEELHQQEVEWLFDYLQPKIDQETADSEEQLYYAIMLGEYQDEPETSISLLEGIMEAESEDTWVYREAQNYLNYLQTEDLSEEDIYFD